MTVSVSPDNIILVGDRVLIKQEEVTTHTRSGLYLPASVQEKEDVRAGWIVQVGPGHMIPNPEFDEQPWATESQPVRYLPLQAEPGDYAFFLRKEAIELKLDEETYLIIPHNAILALARDSEDDAYYG
jgi:co-chaperonin GroES (HSP10)